jgi:6-phosphogluconolactonase
MYTAYIGTYTETLPHVEGKAKGVLIYQFDPQTGLLHAQGVATGVVNPSFVTLSADRRFLYAVQEIGEYAGGTGGAVSAFAIDSATGNLTLLNTQPTHGAHPCFVSIDQTGEWLLVANYSGGNVTVLPILTTGAIGEPSDVVPHIATAAHTRPPHPHAIVHEPIGNWIVVPDCGLDRVAIYRLNTTTGKLIAHDPPWATLAEGAGPRHLAFHPALPIVYVINETNLTLTTFAYDAQQGHLAELQTLDTLPRPRIAGDSCADIHVHPNGRFVYGSNRGHNSIVIFAVNDDGRLTHLGHHATGGRTPRNFVIDPTGTWLLVANQDSSTIQCLKIDQQTGMLSTGPLNDIPTPVCIRMY